MPRAKDTKVWNDDLVRAMEVRENAAMAKGQARATVWQKGAQDLRRVSKDIYTFKNGRVVGLPQNLSVTVRNEVAHIIEGKKPVVPDEMRDFDPQQPGGYRPRAGAGHQHPYLNKMQYRGGGYALLLAFHHHPPPFNRGSFKYKDELIREAQPYSDDQMQPNFWAGRTTSAGWKSIDSLIRHRLVHRQDNRNGRRAAGWQGGPKDEFSLTEAGREFIRQMVQRWPDAGRPAGHGGNGGGHGSGHGGSGGGGGGGVSRAAGEGPRLELSLTELDNIAIPISYFLCGFMPALVDTPVTVYLVDTLNAKPAQQNSVAAAIALPWCFKVGFGFLTDAFPLSATARRTPYFVLGFGIHTAATIVLASAARL
eukprot:g8102.t1